MLVLRDDAGRRCQPAAADPRRRKQESRERRLAGYSTRYRRALVEQARTQRNLVRLKRVLEDAKSLERPGANEWVERARLAVSAVYGDDSPQQQRFNRIRFAPGVYFDGMPASMYDDAFRGGVEKATAALRAFIEDVEEDVERPELPSAAVSGMHPWVRDVAARLWQDGHRRQAVQAAAANVETWLRAKLAVHEGSSASLVASAFATSSPGPGSPRLRFPDLEPEGSDRWKSAHDGAGAFGRGCMLRIRNLYAHSGRSDADEDLEALAALSLLARWIDSAEVVESQG